MLIFFLDMNLTFSSRPGWFFACLILMAVFFGFPSLASEYEVSGKIHQVIISSDGGKQEDSGEFTVYVRDCSWLIKTIYADGHGNLYQREVGSTNGADIIEAGVNLKAAPAAGQPSKNKPALNVASIRSNSIPVGLLDKDVVAHLWLMFASRCYWSSLNTDMLTPVYDWRASVPMNPNMKVPAKWELMGGPGSLPREVAYLGQWEETNGLYMATGTNSTGGMLFPNGFIFEERHVGPLAPNSFIHEMTLRKRVEAVVTSVSPVCSIQSLVPNAAGRTVIIDWRLVTPAPSTELPSYRNPVPGKWPSINEARELAKANSLRNLHKQAPQPLRAPVLIALLCSFLLGPFLIYIAWKKPHR